MMQWRLIFADCKSLQELVQELGHPLPPFKSLDIHFLRWEEFGFLLENGSATIRSARTHSMGGG